MAKTKAAPKKKTLREEVTELKDSLALLVNTLSANIQTNTPAPIVEQTGAKRGRPRKNVDENDTGRGMRQGQSPHLKARSKTMAGSHSIQTGPRPNLFEKMPNFNLCKEDTKIDKKLWKGRTPTPRGERTTIVDAICEKCNYTFSVSPNELKRTLDENERTVTSYICDRCIRNRS